MSGRWQTLSQVSCCFRLLMSYQVSRLVARYRYPS
jgi:hypothetical protein